MPGFCRDCLADADEGSRCPSCGGPRLLQHPELDTLSIAHIDCDAFYASIEKRDNPDLRDRPVIVGGGKRGVVSTACYIARISGVRSAMPMFKALKLCPDAVVIKPDFTKYSAVGRQVKTMMRDLTPLVESLSIDEAFLDLSGTERVHGMSPARVLARFTNRVVSEVGISVSVGLAPNKFLAKIASDLDKPRGFSTIGRAEAVSFLDGKPVGILPGVGAAARTRLESEGLHTVGDIRRADPKQLGRIHGGFGLHLWKLAHGEDTRLVRAERETKSVSAETTFNEDISDARELTEILWRLSERVSARLKAAEFSGTRVTLKLKTSDFRTRTRSRTLDSPTRLAGRIFDTGRDMLLPEAQGDRFRLVGIGVEDLHPLAEADPPDLIDTGIGRRIATENAIDRIRAKFGTDSVGRGIGFRNKG